MNQCKYCGREINNKGSLAAHEKYCKKNPESVPHPVTESNKRKIGKGIPPWNKGLTLKDAVARGIITEETRQSLLARARKAGHMSGGTASTIEGERDRRRKISETMKKNPAAGGKRQGSGRGKKGWYKGYFCDSSWELAYVIYNLDHNIQFARNTEGFKYLYEGVERIYIPDFIEDGGYVEIKGYRTKQWESKLNQFKGKLKTLYKEEMSKYLSYVESTYGKDFISMYE